MSPTDNVPGEQTDEAAVGRAAKTISFRITVGPGRTAEAVAEDTVPGGVKTRPELTVRISGGPELTDTVLYDDAAVPGQSSAAFPRYRVAEETVSGRQQYRIALQAARPAVGVHGRPREVSRPPRSSSMPARRRSFHTTCRSS